MGEAEVLGAYMTGGPDALSREAFVRHFAPRSSTGFDPDRDLARIGVANQTTMLATESLAIGARLREMMAESFGEEHAEGHFRSFGTICSATQERQDAILEMMEAPPGIMIVVGGYNSSNTNHLAHLCREYTTTYHVKDASCIDTVTGAIHHKPELDPHAPEVVARGTGSRPGPSSWASPRARRRRTTRSGKRWRGFWRSGGSSWSCRGSGAPSRQAPSHARRREPSVDRGPASVRE